MGEIKVEEKKDIPWGEYWASVWRKVKIGLGLLFAFVVLIAILVMVGPGTEKGEVEEKPKEKPKPVIEVITINEQSKVKIMSFEEHRYMEWNGNLIHLESCKCKKPKVVPEVKLKIDKADAGSGVLKNISKQEIGYYPYLNPKKTK